MPREKVLESRYVFRGRSSSVRVDRVARVNGNVTTREIVEHGDGVAIVAVDEGDILLVRQYRHATGKELLEVPAGGIDPGETPDEAVRRELQEETGFIPGRVEKMGAAYPAPGYCTELLHLYLATELTPSRLIADDTADIELVRVPQGDIRRLITSGEVCDAKSVASLLLYLQRAA